MTDPAPQTVDNGVIPHFWRKRLSRARTWIETCVDPVAVRPEVKAAMLNYLDGRSDDLPDDISTVPAPPVTVTDAMVERADESISWVQMDARYGRVIEWPDSIRRELLHAAVFAALTEDGAE